MLEKEVNFLDIPDKMVEGDAERLLLATDCSTEGSSSESSCDLLVYKINQ